MQRKIHTFRAATMDAAMDLVRQELGKDAVVVNAREIATRRMLPWPSTRQEVEVSAEPVSRGSKPSLKSQVISQGQKSPRMIRTLAETMSTTFAPSRLLAPMPELLAETADGECVSQEKRSPSVVTDERQDEGELTSGYQRNLDSLQTIVERLSRQSRPSGMNDVPGELFQYYLKLVAADIEDEVARELIGKLQRQPASVSLDSASITATLTALIEREMRCTAPITHQSGRREIVTLVGPTGVGKTTTLAKLAAHFHLHEGLRVGVITIDSYRVGAVDQLRTYAEILQIAWRSASTPDELRIAIDDLDSVDLILIDTAGRSPLDRSKLNDLREIVEVAASDHVLLVLSLAAGPRMLTKIAEQFAIVSPTSLVLTKLDETPGIGGLLSVARDIPCPISYLTTGQDVPDQIEPAHPTRLARLILGSDQIHCELKR